MLHSNLIGAIGNTPLPVMLSEAKHLAPVRPQRDQCSAGSS